MTLDQAKVVVAGLPKSGKTTFLAALWETVSSRYISTSLQLKSLKGDYEYLNAIRDAWADCNEVSRTPIAAERVVTMVLEDPQSHRILELHLPDPSGESFKNQWVDRTAPAAYKDFVEVASGVAVFLHPLYVEDGTLIKDAQAALVGIERPVSAIQGSDEATVPFDLSRVATQVILVELLQFIAQLRPHDNPPRVAVIVSAWDLVPVGERAAPSEWLRKNLPLLEQYLVANREAAPFKVFGVSAQGGDLKDAQNLRTFQRPTDRISVTDGQTESKDITWPVRWLI